MAVSERPPFNDRTETVIVTPEEEALGLDTYYAFTQKLIRPLPWTIKNNVVRYVGHDPVEEGMAYLKDKNEKPKLKVDKRVIRLDDLAKESIPQHLAYLLADFKMIEDKLPDFMGTATGLYRNVQGISRAYNQWGAEEGQHSDAIRMILLGTGHEEAINMDKAYYAELAKTWQLPFPTGRMMSAYAGLQEPRTKGYYEQLREVSLSTEAWNVSAMLNLILKDEGYHGGGFRVFGQVYDKYDHEGTVDDNCHVLENFRMPAQNLLKNRRRSLLAFARLEQLIDPEKEAIEQLVPALLATGFVPPERAWASGAKYAEVADLGKSKFFVPEGMPSKDTKLVSADGSTPLVRSNPNS